MLTRRETSTGWATHKWALPPNCLSVKDNFLDGFLFQYCRVYTFPFIIKDSAAPVDYEDSRTTTNEKRVCRNCPCDHFSCNGSLANSFYSRLPIGYIRNRLCHLMCTQRQLNAIRQHRKRDKEGKLVDGVRMMHWIICKLATITCICLTHHTRQTIWIFIIACTLAKNKADASKRRQRLMKSFLATTNARDKRLNWTGDWWTEMVQISLGATWCHALIAWPWLATYFVASLLFTQTKSSGMHQKMLFEWHWSSCNLQVINCLLVYQTHFIKKIVCV